MRLSNRGIVLPSKSRAFLVAHLETCGPKLTAKRLGVSTSCVAGLVAGYRCEVRTALAIFALSQRLGFDRCQWLRDLPTDAPPVTARSYGRRVAKAQAPQVEAQRSLF